MEVVNRILAYDAWATLSIVVLYANAIGAQKLYRWIRRRMVRSV